MLPYNVFQTWKLRFQPLFSRTFLCYIQISNRKADLQEREKAQGNILKSNKMETFIPT